MAEPTTYPFEVRWAPERGWLLVRDCFTGEWLEVEQAGGKFKRFADRAVEGLREIAQNAAGVALGQLTAQLGTGIAEKFTEGATAMNRFGYETLALQRITGGSVEE